MDDFSGRSRSGKIGHLVMFFAGSCILRAVSTISIQFAPAFAGSPFLGTNQLPSLPFSPHAPSHSISSPTSPCQKPVGRSTCSFRVPIRISISNKVQMQRNFLKFFLPRRQLGSQGSAGGESYGAHKAPGHARGPWRALVGSGAHTPPLHRLSAL